MSALDLLRRLRLEGFNVRLDGDGLVLSGPRPIDREARQELARLKSEVIQLLAAPGSAERHPTSEDLWNRMRELGAHLGRTVMVDGRDVLLWGLSPRGAAVDTGCVIMSVGFEEVIVVNS